MFLPIPTLQSLDVGIHGRKAFLCQHLVCTHFSIPHFSSTSPFSLSSKGGGWYPSSGGGGFTPLSSQDEVECLTVWGGGGDRAGAVQNIRVGSWVTETDRQEQPYRTRTVPCGKLYVGVIRLYHNTARRGGGHLIGVPCVFTGWGLSQNMTFTRSLPPPSSNLPLRHRESG